MFDKDTYNHLVISCISITLIFSLCFYFLKIPKKESFNGYRTSRKIMALAYMIVCILNVTELIFISGKSSQFFTSLVTLIVAAFQSILFTFTLIALIDIHLISKNRIIREISPVVFLSILSIFTYFENFNHFYKPVFFTFVVYYITQIVRFSFLFFSSYRLYLQKINNYFSVHEANRLRWVKTAYFATLVTGGVALSSFAFGNEFSILFNIVYLIFFIYFGIGFINYVYIFQEIEVVIFPEETKETRDEKELSFSFSQLEYEINKWEKKKHFTFAGLTIEQVASDIKTNRTYLSNYINTYKKKNFNEWINSLRIEEAKILMIEHPDLPVSQIGVMIGLSDKSNFGRQFSKMTGCSPLAWRTTQFCK